MARIIGKGVSNHLLHEINVEVDLFDFKTVILICFATVENMGSFLVRFTDPGSVGFLRAQELVGPQDDC
jgi:hypothetical protein